ncbi:MAG: cytochrome d ubiquinol oxidase subunit II, partial [Pseudomonadota bacterium]|nr:cytochrome d ubiquinol oxidase subunit II [Pseudomonadota bacterium]
LVMGFDSGVGAHVFAALIGLCVAAGYTLLGAGWLIIKSEGALQRKAVGWAKRAMWGTVTGVVAVSIATPMLSPRVAEKWFALDRLPLLALVPVATIVMFFVLWRSLRRLPTRLDEGNEYGAWVPFAASVGIFVLAFYGLAYSLFPYLVVDRLTIWQAAAAPESMMVVFAGTCVVLPVILAYNAFAYKVFSGKAQALDYSWVHPESAEGKAACDPAQKAP